MKLYKKIFCGVAATLSVAALQSCSEEKATLEGANTVYIEMQPKDVSMAVGDTVLLSATVSNESGDIINTPITWSVDNEDIVELTEKITYKKVKKSSLSRAEGDDETGDDPAVDPNEPGDDDPLNPDPEPEDPGYTLTEIRQPCIVAKLGSQNKTTNVRATLENGQYAVSPVSVVARDLSKAVTAYTTFKRSYSRSANDTVWFKVTPFALVDESEIKFEMNITETITEDATTGEWNGKFVNPRIYIDREQQLVGVVYTGPRMTGKGECKLWLESGGLTSQEAVVPITIYPLIWPGFEVDGKRPGYGPPTPSNIKITLMNETMDINSTFDVGVCLGIDAGSDVEIENVKAAEKAGMMYWTVDGSAVVVEDAYWDLDYTSGYVSYLKIRSGQRKGLSVIKYVMPDTVLTCNMEVDDYDNSYPVERIKVLQDSVEINKAVFKLGLPANLEISVEPEPSYEYHIPEVTVADPSVLEVQPQAENSGYTRTFTLRRVGETTITMTSLDKTLTIPVVVEDRIDYVGFDNANPTEMYVGTSATIQANPHWASGKTVTDDVVWTVSDESIARVTPTGKKLGQATLEALKEGTVRIIASCNGTNSAAYELTVKPAEDIYASTYSDALIIGDTGSSSVYLVFGEDMDVYAEFPMVEEGVIAGTFSGSDAHVELGSNIFDGCSYSVTITDNGDDTYSVTGTITMPTGARLVMRGEVFILG